MSLLCQTCFEYLLALNPTACAGRRSESIHKLCQRETDAVVEPHSVSPRQLFSKMIVCTQTTRTTLTQCRAVRGNWNGNWMFYVCNGTLSQHMILTQLTVPVAETWRRCTQTLSAYLTGSHALLAHYDKGRAHKVNCEESERQPRSHFGGCFKPPDCLHSSTEFHRRANRPVLAA